MLYLFTGSDENKVREKAFSWVEAARAKAPDASYIRINRPTITQNLIDEISASQGLFFSKLLVLLDEPDCTEDRAECLMENAELLANSANPIALLLSSVPAKLEKKLEPLLAKKFVVDLKTKKPAKGFNSALVNALSARDSKKLWLELEKAKRDNEAAEAMHGLLHWKARDMIGKGGAKWTKDEARNLSISLIELLSEARGGGLSLWEELERFALTL